MKLFWKGLLLIAVPVLFQLVSLAVLYEAQQQAAAAEGWALHSKEVLSATSDVNIRILREALRFRGAVLAGTPSMANDDFWALLDQRIVSLGELVSDNPTQKERVAAIRSDALAYRAALQKTEGIAESGNVGDIRRRYAPGGGVEVLPRMEERLKVFQDEERRLDYARVSAAGTARRQLLERLYLLVAISIAIGVLSVYLFTRGIGQRLNTVTRNAERLARHEALVERAEGRDEIAFLDSVLQRTSSQLRKASAERLAYEDTLLQRATELAHVNEDLTIQRQENEMFVYSVSHDLRSPLVNLQGFGKELSMACAELQSAVDHSSLTSEDKERFLTILSRDFEVSLKFINAAVARSSSIIDALLKLSRVGRIEFRPERLDIQAMVQTIVDATAGTQREKSAQLSIVGELPPVVGDEAMMQQIFANLIQNALNYLDPARPGQIEISGAENNGYVTYRVKDNGYGIATRHLSKLFLAFKRFHPRAAGGEGIGLAYSKRAIERHGGKIWVESTENEGSVFYLSLPTTQKAIEVGEALPSNDTQEFN